MIAVIDYGMGNIHSVAKALQASGAEVLVTNKPEDIKKSDKLVLPGVGAFSDAMVELKKFNLLSAIKDSIAKKPLLGICLGMQLLFDKSQEAENQPGLSILSGDVVKFSSKLKLKVPHMGWNNLKVKAAQCPLLKGITDQDQVYFCHSYYPVPKESGTTAACAEYGLEFAAVVWKNNLYGAQFHPEKSQTVGLKIIRNFVELC
jgi:glutamine amidotransferase